nr:ulp1 protease family, C-terminal catalytic domain-containing protein [Tanacetum cinerariifolium]
MIKEKCYNIYQDLLSVREKLDEGLSRFLDYSVTEGKGVKFVENDKVLVDDVPKEKYSLNECDAVIQDENKIKVFVQYLYYVKHPKAEAIEKAKIKRMKMSWRTTHNSIDCGVFTMLHMESYTGAEGEWKCGLAKESKKQNEQLNSLRSKFAAKIILSEFNLLREKFMKLVPAFEQKTEEERKKTIDDAIANRDDREEI